VARPYNGPGETVFGCAGQKSHAKPLDGFPSLSSVTSPLKSIGREQIGHFGQGLYMTSILPRGSLFVAVDLERNALE
jgi:hypothetical protein